MSDEPPPSLRLKPRLKPEADPAASADAASTPTPKAEEGGMKIRLRPKLSADPEPEPEPEHPASSPDDISAEPERLPEPEPLPEPEAPPPPPVVSEGGPKFRLKTKAADPAAGAARPAAPATAFVPPDGPPEGDPANPAMMQFDPSSEMNIPVPSSPLYVPTTETPATESVRVELSSAPPPVPLQDIHEEEEALPPPVTPPKRRKLPVKAGTLSLIAAVVFILGCGAFFVHRVMTAPTAGRPVKQKSRIKSIPVAPEPTPTPAPTPTPMPQADDPKPKAAVTNLVTTSIAPGISATSAGAVEAVNASPQFRSWVAAARISGVFQGAVPRALINGRTIRAGSLADEGLGITFESIDAESKTIVFKDRYGAEVSRRYQ